MGAIERKVAEKVRRTKINTAIVTTLALTGGLAVVAVAPHVAGVLGKVFNAQHKQGVKRSLSRLIAYGYVTVQNERGKKRVRLTSQGEKYAALFEEGILVPKKPRKWDGKWRVLIFDIPEKRKGIREQVRRTLVTLGFQRLQDSVWVYPYDWEDLITLLKADFKIGKDILYIVADAIEYDRPLRVLFGLASRRQ